MKSPRYILDTGPLVAFLNRRDKHHAWAMQVLAVLGEAPITCEAVLAEVCWHVRTSPETVTRVLEMPSRGDLHVLPLIEDEGVNLAGKIRKYGDKMDVADACVLRLSEMFPQAKVITTDITDFQIYRRNRESPCL